ncbi:tail length tape measure protein [Rhizobium azibense]|nr:tail length tape measure protein [Rhizobium azibense]
MAETDSGGLLVQIGVTQARMERELAKVVKQMADAAKKGEDAFNSANDNIGKGANKAFGALGSGANKATGAINNTSGATSNLASQLNDIGVQLAGGQSPFLIMLQQGTQITQLFTQTGGSIRGFGSILAGAVTSVLNPFSLLTFAIIGVGGAAVQYFADVISGGEDANKTIEDQQKLVAAVAKEWAEAVPALKEYVDQLERAKSSEELQQVAAQHQKDVWAEVNQEFESFREKYRTITALLYNASNVPTAPLHDLGEAYTELVRKIQNGTAKAEDFKRVAEALDASKMRGDLDQFGDGFKSFAFSVQLATDKLAAFMNQAGQATRTKFPSPGSYNGVDRSNDGPIQNPGEFSLPENGPTPDRKPSTESMYPGDSWNKPSRGRGSSRGANAYKDEVAGIKERTAALQASTAAQAAINPLVKDYGYAAAKAAAEQRLLADAERSKITVTPQLRESISTLAGAYADATAEAKKLAESQDEIRKRAEEWINLEKDVLGGFITDLSKGKSLADALADSLGKIGNKLLDMALDDAFSTKAGGGGGGFFSSLLSGIGKIFGYASGTANTGGKRGQPAGVVHGQEAVIPLPAGGKVPVTINTPNASDIGRKGSGDVSISIPVTIDAAGADPATLARVENQLANLQRTLPATVVTTVKDAQRRRIIE